MPLYGSHSTGISHRVNTFSHFRQNKSKSPYRGPNGQITSTNVSQLGEMESLALTAGVFWDNQTDEKPNAPPADAHLSRL